MTELLRLNRDAVKIVFIDSVGSILKNVKRDNYSSDLISFLNELKERNKKNGYFTVFTNHVNKFRSGIIEPVSSNWLNIHSIEIKNRIYLQSDKEQIQHFSSSTKVEIKKCILYTTLVKSSNNRLQTIKSEITNSGMTKINDDGQYENQ